MNYKKFDLLAEATNGKLTNDVNVRLKQGWELYGFPFIEDGLFFQAMVNINEDNAENREKHYGNNIRK